MKDQWTPIAAAVLIADSLLTLHVGVETNPFILYFMKRFDLTLAVAMGVRLIFCLPLLFIIDQYKQARLMVIAYAILYILAAAVNTALFFLF